MKIFKLLSLVMVVALTVSCEKHEITYDSTPLTNKAEFQLHYMNPVTNVAANYIYRIEVNDVLYANRKAPLTPYNAAPGGAVGRFYNADPGTVNIKMFQGPADTSLVKVYDQSVTLTTGKQNVFVHDFNLPPVVFDNGYPYIANVTDKTDSIAWIKFYNFLYETAGVTSALRIQYQYLDSRTNLAVNIGSPVSFGETTGWQKVTVVKSTNVSSGSRQIYFNMRVVDANGNDLGKLKIMNTAGTLVDYTDYWTLYIGRRYHHIMAGFRAVKSPNSSVKVFTAL
ncbi:MAG: hypothetical protein NT092_11885 [Bacteroidia bacterium]|nr:hypothetical protein [Bacteroidia bacterium]